MSKPKKKSVTSEESKRIAEAIFQPEQQMAQVLQQHMAGPAEQAEFRHWVETLRRNQQQVVDGDLSHLEAMLVAQSEALQGLFLVLATCAQRQKQLPAIQAMYGLAFRAQAGSRATIQAIVDLKYPKQAATFIRQGNVAAQQIVANGDVLSRARETANAPNELLEAKDGERLGGGAAGTAEAGDSALETVDALNRAAKP